MVDAIVQIPGLHSDLKPVLAELGMILARPRPATRPCSTPGVAPGPARPAVAPGLPGLRWRRAIASALSCAWVTYAAPSQL